VLRYGNARDLVLGLEVVLADGRIWHGLSGLRKDNTGYDLKQLFLGSEGTLGIITAAVLKLFPKPRSRATAFIGCASPHHALRLLERLQAGAGDALSGFEFMAGFALDIVLRHMPGVVRPLAAAHGGYVLAELTSPDPDADLAGRLEMLLAAALIGVALRLGLDEPAVALVFVWALVWIVLAEDQASTIQAVASGLALLFLVVALPVARRWIVGSGRSERRHSEASASLPVVTEPDPI